MQEFEIRNFDSSDETLPFVARGSIDVITLGDITFKYVVHEPGWQWSRDTKPLIGTDRCEKRHTAYVLSGALEVFWAGGQSVTVNATDLCKLEPGHDARTVGREDCVFLDVSVREPSLKNGTVIPNVNT